jgi:hypothetical protein
MARPFVVGLAVAGLLLMLGLLVVLYELGGLVLRLRFSNDYLRRFTAFVNNWSPGRYNQAEYDWLLRRSNRMQADLGTGGMTSYKPAGFLNFIPGYAVLLNTLPEIADGSADPDIARGCRETLVRHIGVLEDGIKTRLLYLLNPVQWLVYGLEVPGRLLAAMRIVTPVVGEGRLFRLITLISAVVIIFANWDQATGFLRFHKVIP